MKKSVDVIGLPVIDISEGNEVGTVTKIIINPIEGSIAALVVDDGTWYLGAKLLPFTEIAGLGESAITIISNDAILTVATAPALEQLLRTNVAIIGTKVLTKAGQLVGTVTEIIFDSTGKITACEIEELTGEASEIPAQRVLTFGKKVLIIADDNSIAAPVKPPAAVATNDKKTVSAPEAPAAVEAPVVVPDPTPAPAAQEAMSDDSAKKFDEKQRKYLLGKHASRRIETDNGVLIVDQDGEINEEVLQKAKLAGKFVELSMNIQ